MAAAAAHREPPQDHPPAWAPRAPLPPAMGRREALLLAVGASLLMCAMFWPLPLHLGRDIPKDLGDPLLQAWQVAWGGHALLDQPLHFWQANIFYPGRDSLAYSDSLAGYAPFGILGGDGVRAAVFRYDLLFLFAYALTFSGAYALARELGTGSAAAIVAGAAWAFSPWRWEQSGHLHVISAGPIALSLALLLRGYRRDQPKAVVAGWAVAAWQVAIGVTLGLQMLYLLAVLAAVAVVAWQIKRRPPLPRRLLRATGIGVVLVAIVVGLVAPPYLRVKHDYPEGHRSYDVVRAFSPPLRSFVSASKDNPIWGAITAPQRDKLSLVPEQTLFPGALTVLLAAGGLLASAYSRRLRAGLLVAGALTWLFSLGSTPDDGRFTYKLLYDHAPGWDGSRTPGRLHVLTTLALALLAAGAVQWLLGRFGRRRLIGTAVAGLLAAGILLEGAAFSLDRPGAGQFAGAAHPTVVPAPRGAIGLPDPQIAIPPDLPGSYLYTIWSTEGFPRIVNGTSGLDPHVAADLRAASHAFPAAQSVEQLRAAGIRTVIWYPGFAAGGEFADVPSRRIDPALGITRRTTPDGLIVFDLGSRR